MKAHKTKVALVPKWKPKAPAHIALLKWKLARGWLSGLAKSYAEKQIADWEAANS